ncbi:MAG: hypothetical protein JWM93_2655 [Frankiales bacterium]|nr:hypothetical protein [Frankiales bacterium]
MGRRKRWPKRSSATRSRGRREPRFTCRVLEPLGHRVTHPAVVDQADTVHRIDCRLKPTGDVVPAGHVLWRQRAPGSCGVCRSVMHTVLTSERAK